VSYASAGETVVMAWGEAKLECHDAVDGRVRQLPGCCLLHQCTRTIVVGAVVQCADSGELGPGWEVADLQARTVQ
jgi:hypothetical protein